jgi:hypothetical protein
MVSGECLTPYCSFAVTREGVGTGQAQVRQRTDWAVPDDAGAVENFLELGCGCAGLMRRHLSFAPQVNGVKNESQALSRRTEFVRSSRGKRFDCLGGAAG